MQMRLCQHICFRVDKRTEIDKTGEGEEGGGGGGVVNFKWKQLNQE